MEVDNNNNGEHIAIRPTKQTNTIIWHQNDPLDDVPIMSMQVHHHQPQIKSSIPPPQQQQVDEEEVVTVKKTQIKQKVVIVSPRHLPRLTSPIIKPIPILLSRTPSPQHDYNNNSFSPTLTDHHNHYCLNMMSPEDETNPVSFVETYYLS
nr:1002_t:CDS:2 [Entrophospora candida]